MLLSCGSGHECNNTFPKLNCMGRLSCTSLIRKREMKKKHKENDSKLNWLMKISLKLLSKFTQILIRMVYIRICLVHFKVSSLYSLLWSWSLHVFQVFGLMTILDCHSTSRIIYSYKTKLSVMWLEPWFSCYATS